MGEAGVEVGFHDELVSIIVPVYEVEEYLPACIESILAQTYNNFELILVDDGSPDKCGDICEAYAAKDARIRVFHQENQGLSAARNAGMRVSSGECLSFVDSDDTVAPDYVEYLVSLLNLDRTADLAVCGVKRSWRNVPERAVDPLVEGAADALSRMLFSRYFGVFAWNKLYTRRALDGVSYPVGQRYEDSAVIGFILANCRKVAFGFEQKYFYRNDRISSFMHTYSQKVEHDKKHSLDTMEHVIARSLPAAYPSFLLYAVRSCSQMLSHLSKSTISAREQNEDANTYKAWLTQYYRRAKKEGKMSLYEKINTLLWLYLRVKVNRVLRDCAGIVIR